MPIVTAGLCLYTPGTADRTVVAAKGDTRAVANRAINAVVRKISDIDKTPTKFDREKVRMNSEAVQKYIGRGTPE
jgi:hypothetical protein